MNDSSETPSISTPKLGKIPAARIQFYFCLDDEKCHAFSRVSKEAKVISRERKRIIALGKAVDGWVVELMVPATDGRVREDRLD